MVIAKSLSSDGGRGSIPGGGVRGGPRSGTEAGGDVDTACDSDSHGDGGGGTSHGGDKLCSWW